MPLESNSARFVEVGQAVVSEIIDHNRVSVQKPHHSTPLPHPYTQAIVDGPTTGVPRQALPYRHLTLRLLPTLKKYLDKADTVYKWESSAWAKKRAAAAKRRTLTDFERFQVLVHKKARRDKVRKVLKAAKA
ncbi:60S ribosomal protein L14 [Lactarius akahatsu]|uniref:60S ribosomal protein L14 n=1 Tax=Lactarius akahatsu TaxID=416441 RepID=A0AAD4L6T1_9AGAM|nr:60S ribosomal protein L14 [Lactarius akahatsu]